MSLTTLDSKTALILIDLQKGIVTRQAAHPMAPIVAHASELAEAFRKHGLPVVLVNVAGGAPGRTEHRLNLADLPPDWTELVPELNCQPSDHVVTKRTWGAFASTDINERLTKLGVTQVVLAGVATSIGVESTARQAYEGGFNVTLASDAMTDLNTDAHVNSMTRIFPRLGEIGTTAEIIDLLGKTRG